MKIIKASITLFLVFGFLWVSHNNLCYAQKPLHTLILLYSNNINGEIVPCLT